MNIEAIKETLANKNKGQFVTVSSEKSVKLKTGQIVLKRSTLQVRVGHNYYAQKSVKEAIESGEKTAHGLPEYLERINEALVKHKTKETVYLTGQPSGNKPVSEWVMEGKPVSYEEIEPFLYAKDKKKGSKPEHIRLPIENIISLS